VWAAARYNLPGIIAHESALREGELLSIPDLGDPSRDAPRLEDALAALAPPIPVWTLPKPAYTGKSWW
jgi:hypothetical protein